MLGLMKNLVLPLPEPPTMSTFLFRAVFGSFGRLFIVRRSVCVRMMLFLNTGSMYGRISSAVPQRAAPYSYPWRYFLAFLPRRYTASLRSRPQAKPTSKSSAWKLGSGLPNAAGMAPNRLSIFSEASEPEAVRHASPRFVQTRPISTYGRFVSTSFLTFIAQAPSFSPSVRPGLARVRGAFAAATDARFCALLRSRTP